MQQCSALQCSVTIPSKLFPTLDVTGIHTMAMQYGEHSAEYCWRILSPGQKTAVFFDQDGGGHKLMSLPKTDKQIKAMSRDRVGLPASFSSLSLYPSHCITLTVSFVTIITTATITSMPSLPSIL